ncbi:MAG: hypothetical protein WC423_27065, partial [Vulcanimicrobiota bacterium]
KGAIVATGKITVTGSMDTQADHAALVAKDDIKIHGDGPNSSRFQGLVYSEKSIDIARTTIMGAAVSKDAAGVTKLEEVRAISVPELTKIEFEVHETLEEAKESGTRAYTGNADPIGIRLSDGSFIELAPHGDSDALKELAVQITGTTDSPSTWQMVIKKGPNQYDPDEVLNNGDAFDALEGWKSYLNEVGSPQGPKLVSIFNLDLNTLVSLDVELEMMYHSTVSRQ